MDSKPRPSFYDEQLSKLLFSFDDRSKEDIAWQLVKTFKLDKNGDAYPDQMERLLKRKLTESERFRVSVLDRVLNLHRGGSVHDGEG